MAQISNPVFGGKCHLIHLTILRRYSWLSLAYMCSKWCETPFIHSYHVTADNEVKPDLGPYLPKKTGDDKSVNILPNKVNVSPSMGRGSAFSHTLIQFWYDVNGDESQQTRDVDPMLIQCWSSVYDAGPPLNQHRVNVSCLLGYGQHTNGVSVPFAGESRSPLCSA